MNRMYWGVLCVTLLSSACVTQEERLLNESEDTILSRDVAKLLAENDGELDTREHPKVGCTRVKIVGSHRVKRYCYTTQEEKEAAESTQNAYYRRFGAQRCLDRGSASCQAGLETGQGGIR